MLKNSKTPENLMHVELPRKTPRTSKEFLDTIVALLESQKIDMMVSFFFDITQGFLMFLLIFLKQYMKLTQIKYTCGMV
jgi:hypothetical protein